MDGVNIKRTDRQYFELFKFFLIIFSIFGAIFFVSYLGSVFSTTNTSPLIQGMHNSSINYLQENPKPVDNITIKGKIVVIDMTGSPFTDLTNDISLNLPDEMKGDINKLAKGSSDNFTVFCIIKQDQINQGQWGETADQPSGAPGYSLNSYIVVYYQSENKIVGWHEVIGSPPPQKATTDELSGKNTTNIGEWIQTLPKLS